MKKYKLVLALILTFGFAGIASAHVKVMPAQVGIGAFQTFTMGVPSEKNISTIALRLVIPEGLTYVSPNVKPGWQITVKKSSNDENATTTEIDWVGGSIPAGFRDEFSFSAKVPSAETTLKWKAYQTYSDGSVVSWDHESIEQPKNPDGTDDFSAIGPYSKTMVVNDLTAPTTPASSSGSNSSTSLTFSIIALVFSILALGLARMRRMRKPLPKGPTSNTDVRF